MLAPFYIYRHIRPDKNEVFYIGKGNNLDKRVSVFKRAYTNIKRNIVWHSIVAINGGIFNVEILFECNTEKEVNEKEIEFISLYKRKKDGGTLANLTDGGEGALGLVFTEEMRVNLRNKIKLRPPVRDKQVINTLTGEIFRNAILAAKGVGINYRNLVGKHFANNYANNKTPLLYLLDYKKLETEACELLTNRPKVHPKGMYKQVIHTVTGEVYDSIKAASDDLGLDVSTVRRRLQGLFNNNTNLKYYDAKSL